MKISKNEIFFRLMSGERENKNIVGTPFTCTEMALVDFKPGTNRCYVITKLEREYNILKQNSISKAGI